MNTLLLIVVFALVLIGLIFGSCVPRSLRRRHYMAGLLFFLACLVMILTAALITCVYAGTVGYKALVREDLAATVYIQPLGSQQFLARIARPGAADTAFTIAGDELYIDARIIKWKPFATLLGLHTAYCLDRIAGRYTDIRDEKTKVRTLYSLAGDTRPWDLFFLRLQWPILAPVLDAQYGSATFASVKNVATLRIMVSASGLLARAQ
jgi:hypothetical protein